MVARGRHQTADGDAISRRPDHHPWPPSRAATYLFLADCIALAIALPAPRPSRAAPARHHSASRRAGGGVRRIRLGSWMAYREGLAALRADGWQRIAIYVRNWPTTRASVVLRWRHDVQDCRVARRVPRPGPSGCGRQSVDRSLTPRHRWRISATRARPASLCRHSYSLCGPNCCVFTIAPTKLARRARTGGASGGRCQTEAAGIARISPPTATPG